MLQHQLSSEHNRLKKLTRRNLTQLVESEFTLAHTLTDLAETEVSMGNADHALTLVRKVGEAIAGAQERVAEADLPEEQKNAITQQLRDLEPRLQSIRQQAAKHSEKNRGRRLSSRKPQ